MSILDSGDVSFTGRGPKKAMLIGVELKSVEEFFRSTNSGRTQGIDGQLPRMLNDYDLSYLLLYGPYRKGPSNNLQIKRGKLWEDFQMNPDSEGRNKSTPFSYLESAIMSIEAVGIRVKHVATKREAAVWIHTLYVKYRKRWKDHKFWKKVQHQTLPMLPKMNALTVIKLKVARDIAPSIGFVIGKRAAERFKSLQEMMEAGIDDWKEIEGIGDVIAKTVYDTIRRKS